MPRFAGAILVVLIACATIPTAPIPDAADAWTLQLEADVARVMSTFEVPGIALAIVKDGRVVTSRGFGVRKLGDPTPVDGKTLFPIASNSKSFTAVTLATLVDEGKLAWDDPVVKHLPDFRMSEGWVTRELTIRDLLSHRSGLRAGAGDVLIFPRTTFTTDEIIERMRYLRPATSLRAKYAYANVHYVLAGRIVAERTGMSWSETVRERILRPLGMNATVAHPADLGDNPNVASAHAAIDHHVSVVASVPRTNSLGSTGVISNVDDLARWMMVLLDGGRIDGTGKRLFSAARAVELWTAQIPIPIAEPEPGLAATRPNFFAAGLGFGLRDYKGRKVVRHFGELRGFVSTVFMVPEERLGIAVLLNAENRDAVMALHFLLLDHYLGGTSPDWTKLIDDAAKENRRRDSSRRASASNPPETKSPASLPIAAYDGEYVDRLYGTVTIKPEDGKHVMRFSRTPGLVGELEHWDRDSFLVRWQDRSLDADAIVTFALNKDGTIAGMKMNSIVPDAFDFAELSFTLAGK